MEGVANGDANAQYVLGWDYCFGMYVTKDYEKAMQYLTMAVNQGHARAMYQIGQMYDSGFGVEQNIQTAIQWYQKAADRGIDAAASRLKTLIGERGM